MPLSTQGETGTSEFNAVVFDLSSFNLAGRGWGHGRCPRCLLFLKSGDKLSIPEVFFLSFYSDVLYQEPIIGSYLYTMDLKSQDAHQNIAFSFYWNLITTEQNLFGQFTVSK